MKKQITDLISENLTDSDLESTLRENKFEKTFILSEVYHSPFSNEELSYI